LGRRGVGAALFALVAVASLVTGAIVLYAKTPKLALEVTRLDEKLVPNGPPGHRVSHIRFFVRYGDPHARVTIVGQGLNPARTLAGNVALRANRPVSYTWNGRTDSGTVAPKGHYALRVNLPDRGRNMLWVTHRIHLHPAGPRRLAQNPHAHAWRRRTRGGSETAS
jgi:hypothetical protein